jgi:hypothetical protein
MDVAASVTVEASIEPASELDAPPEPDAPPVPPEPEPVAVLELDPPVAPVLAPLLDAELPAAPPADVELEPAWVVDDEPGSSLHPICMHATNAATRGKEGSTTSFMRGLLWRTL